MTPSEIAALRALCDAATPGPWKRGVTTNGDGAVLCFVADPSKEPVANDTMSADAAFIAAARTAVPALLSALEEAERRGDNLNDELREANGRIFTAESALEEARRWQMAVADGLGYVNRAEGQSGYEVAEPEVILAAFRTAESRADDLGNAYRVARESCEEERAEGNGGCGCCTRCCKEARDRADALQAEALANHAKYQGAVAAIPVVVAKEIERLRAQVDEAWRAALEAAAKAADQMIERYRAVNIPLSPGVEVSLRDAAACIRALPPPSATAAPDEEEKCGDRNRLAEGPCVLPKGHADWHSDGLGSGWDDASTGRSPPSGEVG